MNRVNVRKSFAMGAIITVVLALIAVVLMKLYGIVEKLVTPLAKAFGVERIFGEITITFLVVLAILILMFVIGAISLLPSLSWFKNKLEDLLLKLYPPLSYVKVLADEKLHVDTERTNWKPVLALMDDQYWPAFIIEENEEWVTLSVLYVPNSDPMEILIARKDSTPLIHMTTEQMLHYNRSYGKGLLSLIPSTSKK